LRGVVVLVDIRYLQRSSCALLGVMLFRFVFRRRSTFYQRAYISRVETPDNNDVHAAWAVVERTEAANELAHLLVSPESAALMLPWGDWLQR